MSIDNPQALDKNLKIFFLRLMTRSIAEKNKKPDHDINKPIDEWDAEDYDGFGEAISE